MVAAAQDRHELLEHAAQLVVHSLADFCLVFLPARTVSCAPSRSRTASRAAASSSPTCAARRCPRSGVDRRRRPTPPGRPGWSATRRRRWPPMSGAFRRCGDIVARLRPGNVAGRAAHGRCGGRSGSWPSAAAPTVPRSRTPTSRWSRNSARRIAVGLANADTSARDHTVAETLQRVRAARHSARHPGARPRGALPARHGRRGRRRRLVRRVPAGRRPGRAGHRGRGRAQHRLRVDHGPDAAPAPGVRDGHDPHPADVLRRTATALARLLPDTLATVVYAVLDPATGELTYANAGHPPPICDHRAGQADTWTTRRGSCSALPTTPPSPPATGSCRPGTGLLFYTDGLIEDRRRDITDGLDALAGAMPELAAAAVRPSRPARPCRPRCWAVPRGPTTCACWPPGLPAYRRSCSARKATSWLTKRKKQHETGTRRSRHGYDCYGVATQRNRQSGSQP